MRYKRIRQFWAKQVRLGRIVFSWAKINRLYLKFLVYLYILFVLAAPFSQVKLVHAPILPPRVEAKVDDRIDKLESFLKKYYPKSPLIPHAAKFVTAADKYGVDWRLLVAISANESWFGKRYVRGSYNAYGWGGGYIYFSSWENGIETITRKIHEDYYKYGKRPLAMEQFGKIYSGQPSWPDWVRKINLWMSRISAHQLAVNN